MAYTTLKIAVLARNAEREGQHRNGGEPGVPPEQPYTIPNVAHHVAHRLLISVSNRPDAPEQVAYFAAARLSVNVPSTSSPHPLE